MKKLFYQMARFGVVGVGNMALDTLIYVGLTRSISFFEHYYLLAALVAFLISASNSFIWNKHWTFKDKMKFSHKQLMTFYFTSAIALTINELTLWTLVHHGGIFDIYAKIAASVMAGGVNFLLQKFWAFRPQKTME